MTINLTLKTIIAASFVFPLAVSSISGLAQEDSVRITSIGDYGFVASGNTLSIFPCEPKPGITQTGSWFIENLTPGEEITQCVAVANTTEETKTVKL